MHAQKYIRTMYGSPGEKGEYTKEEEGGCADIGDDI